MPIPASLPIDSAYLLDVLSRLVNTPSPTGLAEPAIRLVEETLAAFPGITFKRTRKGALLAAWEAELQGAPSGPTEADQAGALSAPTRALAAHAESGENAPSKALAAYVEDGVVAPVRAIAAHADTLGAMVKEIKPNGRLKMTKIGSYAWNTVEGEGCTVFRSGTPGDAGVRGSILIETASDHVYAKQVAENRRDDETMELRLDVYTQSAVETAQAGIQVGDFIAFDPRFEINEGFVRSRHLDNKAGLACILAAVKALAGAGLKPARETCLLISNYEEVSHGAASGIPAGVEELLVVDMAAIGEGQASDEFHASLCVKDSSGPYHHGFSQKLRRIAGEIDLPYKVDIYPHYGSDGSAFWRAGGDAAVALIGPGVDASHSYERTHTDALLATTRWLIAYLLSN